MHVEMTSPQVVVGAEAPRGHRGPLPRPVRWALAYTLVIGPAVAAAALVVDQLLLLTAIAPMFLANWYVSRHGRVPGEGPAGDRELDELFAGTDEHDLPRENEGSLGTLRFALDHPTVIDRLRYPTRAGLIARVAATAISLCGFALLLVGVPDLPWVGALGVFLVLVATGPSARNVAFALEPRYPQRATDDDRARWSRRNQIVERAGCVAVLALVGLVVAGVV